MKKNSLAPTIGIDAADLCSERIDGTRIYILNLLNRFGRIASDNLFDIYLNGKLNPRLAFTEYPNYQKFTAKASLLWTQTRLPRMLQKTNPDVLWMPLHNLPFWRPKGMKSVVTIHDLAFKLFPRFFPAKDLFLLNRLTAYAVRSADKIIAVSRSTARDLQEIYGVPPHKIKVIYHGYDEKLFHLPNEEEKREISHVKVKYKIPPNSRYLIYVGAIQPRKNLGMLVSAFERIKTLHTFKDWKLILAGSDAWLFEELKKQVKNSVWRKDIIFTGNFSIPDLPYLLWGAELFIFPSLYEGFGIPLLEAMACGLPILTAKNSSLVEVAGNNAIFFDPTKIDDLTTGIKELYANKTKREELFRGGLARVKNFSWDKTARETYQCLVETAIS